LSLIAGTKLSSQAEVVVALEKEGFEVTQPIVSRDFAELGIAKIKGRYTKAGAEVEATHGFRDLILRVEAIGPHLVIVKTTTGAAGIVGLEIDKLKLGSIAGTVAGDDTIFIATRSRVGQKPILRALAPGESS
jgi:transcriptional regulator of arginine metabolism